MDIETRERRLNQLLGISPIAEQKFTEHDPFGTIFALIRQGICEEEFNEFLEVNPSGWYDSHTRAVLEQAILSKGVNGSPMLLRTDCDEIVAMNRRQVKVTIH